MKRIHAKRCLWICTFVSVLLLWGGSVLADFFPIPVGVRVKRTVLVSTGKTPAAGGTALVNALAKITTASATNPYLVLVEPGVFDLGDAVLTMKPHVHLQGAGQEATVIASTISDDSFPAVNGTLKMTGNTSLKDLTIRNLATSNAGIALLVPESVTRAMIIDVTAKALGTGDANYAVHVMGVPEAGSIPASSIELTLQNVNALAENAATSNVGLRNYYYSNLTLRGGTFVARGGESAYGIRTAADETTLTAENILALAEDATYNYGLVNGEGVAFLLGGSYSAHGGTQTRAIYNYTSSEITINGVTGLAEEGSAINTCLENAMAKMTVTGGFYTASGGTDARAIYNRRTTSELLAVGVTALAKDSSGSSYGLCNGCEYGSSTNGGGAQAVLNGGTYTAEGGTSPYGIRNTGEDTLLETNQTAALGRDGSSINRGLYNGESGEALLNGGSYIARGGTSAGGNGLQNLGATLEANEVYALGEGGGSYCNGLLNYSDGTVVLSGGIFTGRGASSEARGIYTFGATSSLIAANSTIAAEDGTLERALFISSGEADLQMCTLKATNYSVYHNGGAATVAHSLLVGGPVSGTVTCTAVTRNTTFNTTGCP